MAVKYLDGIQLLKISSYYDESNKNFHEHGMAHVLSVRQIAEDICKFINAPYTIEIELATLLHDVGLVKGKKNHHIEGANMVEDIIKSLNVECDIDLVKTMIREHRTANKNIDSFPVDVKIVNLANREFSLDIRLSIRKIAERSYEYTKSLHPEYSVDEIVDTTTHYVLNKYGTGGYIYENKFLYEVYGKELSKAMDDEFEKYLRDYAKSVESEDIVRNITDFDNYEKNEFGNY